MRMVIWGFENDEWCDIGEINDDIRIRILLKKKKKKKKKKNKNVLYKLIYILITL